VLALTAPADTVGVATGMYYSAMGGDIMFVETSVSKGKDALILTGQLGDVMKESARIALSYVRGHAGELGIDEDAFTEREFGASKMSRNVASWSSAVAAKRDSCHRGHGTTPGIFQLLWHHPLADAWPDIPNLPRPIRDAWAPLITSATEGWFMDLFKLDRSRAARPRSVDRRARNRAALRLATAYDIPLDEIRTLLKRRLR
jgi:hypothetical protein